MFSRRQLTLAMMLFTALFLITSHRMFLKSKVTPRSIRAPSSFQRPDTAPGSTHRQRADPLDAAPAEDPAVSLDDAVESHQERREREEREEELADEAEEEGAEEAPEEPPEEAEPAASQAAAAEAAAAPPVGSAHSAYESLPLSLDAYDGASEFECKPGRTLRRTRPLDLVASGAEWPINCREDNKELCDVVRRTAIDREMLVAVSNSAITGQLSKWIESNRRAKIENLLIIAIDDKLPAWLEERGVAYWARADGARGSHKISAQKFKYVRSFLEIGCSVLMSDIDVVYLQNPFLFLSKDSDIEGTTDGWDEGSAYGWMERLDDPSMGNFGRFRPAMRITAWNSGLWYARATHASLRLMTILAYRMEHEPNTWDQAAFGEEVARPARDGHHAAGIIKRALNHWCFANSKTIFRRHRVMPQLAEHMPVVVHANYHQPKEPRMKAVYDRWHMGERDALDRFAAAEPATTVPAPVLERDYLHSINDGFVSGSNMADAIHAAAPEAGTASCAPRASKHGVSVQLHPLPAAACAAADSLCAAARRAAERRRSTDGAELLLLIAAKDDAKEVQLLLQSAQQSHVENILLVALDSELATKLGETTKGVELFEASRADSEVAALLARFGAHSPAKRLALFKWALLAKLLGYGISTFYVDNPTLFISDPFQSLYRDADIEAMTLGWDDPSAYGYNHVLDDPSMGFTRFCHGSRIVGYEPRFFYARATLEARTLAVRMGLRLERTPPEEVTPLDEERQAFLRELWLPSHHNYTAPGAILRVMNYLCFVNSKVLFRQLRNMPKLSERPVAVQINYHSDTMPRLLAAYAHFYKGDSAELKALPLADSADAKRDEQQPVSCSGTRSWGGASSTLATFVTEMSPWAWGGVGGFLFNEGGKLVTPWGAGSWGVIEGSLFADFAGSKHNVKVDRQSLSGISTRCGDNNVVLLRSIKAAEARK